MQKLKEPGNIIFFDGHCMLCNRFIRYILRADKNDQFHIATLDSEAAENYLKDYHIGGKGNDTVYLLKIQRDGKTELFDKSDAALETLSFIYPDWIISICKIVPKSVRDRVYNFIAKKRYQWFGSTKACAIMDPSLYKDKMLK